MSKNLLVDDEVWAVITAAARVSNVKRNDVLRSALGLSNKYGSFITSEGGEEGLHRRVTIDDMVFDHTLKGTKPMTWHGPDGAKRDVSSWAEVIAATAEWLVSNGRVNGDMPPTGGMRKYPLISTNRNSLSHSAQAKQVGEWWVETWGNVNTKGRNLRRLLRSVGVNPAEFAVTLSSST